MVGFTIMLVVGFIAGIYHHLSSTDNFWHRNLSKKIILSILASFTVPLFLKIISNNGQISNLQNIQCGSIDFYTLIGFSILASLSANSFLNGMSDKFMSQLQKTEEKAIETSVIAEQNRQEIIEVKKESDEAIISARLTKIELHLMNKEFNEALLLINELLSAKERYSLSDDDYALTMLNKAYVIKNSIKNPNYQEIIALVDLAMKRSIRYESYGTYNKICYLTLAGNYDEAIESAKWLCAHEPKMLKALFEDDDFSALKNDGRIASLLNNCDTILQTNQHNEVI